MKNKTSRTNSMKLKKVIAVPQQLKAQSRKILPQQIQAVRVI